MQLKTQKMSSVCVWGCVSSIVITGSRLARSIEFIDIKKGLRVPRVIVGRVLSRDVPTHVIAFRGGTRMAGLKPGLGRVTRARGPRPLVWVQVARLVQNVGKVLEFVPIPLAFPCTGQARSFDKRRQTVQFLRPLHGHGAPRVRPVRERRIVQLVRPWRRDRVRPLQVRVTAHGLVEAANVKRRRRGPRHVRHALGTENLLDGFLRPQLEPKHGTPLAALATRVAATAHAEFKRLGQETRGFHTHVARRRGGRDPVGTAGNARRVRFGPRDDEKVADRQHALGRNEFTKTAGQRPAHGGTPDNKAPDPLVLHLSKEVAHGNETAFEVLVAICRHFFHLDRIHDAVDKIPSPPVDNAPNAIVKEQVAVVNQRGRDRRLERQPLDAREDDATVERVLFKHVQDLSVEEFIHQDLEANAHVFRIVEIRATNHVFDRARHDATAEVIATLLTLGFPALAVHIQRLFALDKAPLLRRLVVSLVRVELVVHVERAVHEVVARRLEPPSAVRVKVQRRDPPPGVQEVRHGDTKAKWQRGAQGAQALLSLSRAT